MYHDCERSRRWEREVALKKWVMVRKRQPRNGKDWILLKILVLASWY